jgi:hypothetical protein
VTAFASGYDPQVPTSLKPNMSGDQIYQIFNNKNYIIHPATKDLPAESGATIINDNKNLFGFGQFNADLKFGTKDAELNGELVKDAPWVSEITTNKSEIL